MPVTRFDVTLRRPLAGFPISSRPASFPRIEREAGQGPRGPGYTGEA